VPRATGRALQLQELRERLIRSAQVGLYSLELAYRPHALHAQLTEPQLGGSDRVARRREDRGDHERIPRGGVDGIDAIAHAEHHGAEHGQRTHARRKRGVRLGGIERGQRNQLARAFGAGFHALGRAALG